MDQALNTPLSLLKDSAAMRKLIEMIILFLLDCSQRTAGVIPDAAACTHGHPACRVSQPRDTVRGHVSSSAFEHLSEISSF